MGTHRVWLDWLALYWQFTHSPKQYSHLFAPYLPVIHFEQPLQSHIMGQSQRQMAFIKQIHWFLMPVMVFCFGLLHKTMGRVSVNFSCILPLLSALEKGKLTLTLSSFQSKHPSLLTAPLNLLHQRYYKSLCRGHIFVGVWVPEQCWCLSAASPSAPNPSSASVPSALIGTHLITMHTAKVCAIACNMPFEIKAN